MRWTVVVAIAAGVAAAAIVTSRSTRSPRSPSVPMTEGVRLMAHDVGLPDSWGDFFALVAHGESEGNHRAVNDSAREAEAARDAFERSRARFSKCNNPEESYTWGSGGLFGFLPASAFAQMKTGRCLSPHLILTPEVSLAAAVGFAGGLMRSPKFKAVPTWANLRAMWGWPAKGGDRERLANRRPIHEGHAIAVGLPPSFLDQSPPPLAMTADDVLRHFGIEAGKESLV